MIVFSLKEDRRLVTEIPNTGFFLKGDKNLCFLIHGLTGTAKEMGSIAKHLNKQGFSVIAPLMANHDKSISCLKRTSWQTLYDSIRSEFIKYANDYENIFVAGLSFGALIGIMLAHEFPHKVRALNCFSPTLFFDGWGNPKSRVFLPLAYKTQLKYWIYFKEEYPYGIKNERLRAKIEGFYKEAKLFDYSKVHLYGYPVIPVSCMYQNELLAKKVISVLKEIKTPIQLMQAEDDDVTSPKNSYYIYNRISSKEKRIVFLKNSYHIITADQERDKVAQATEEFFKKYRG
ncbi:MAG: alpha/beta fold hydrolase [Candidatus Omnitrophica bacterium]|jgi:carboxylesterase|nr:alpha/beta fold hydrolase [Candidatus Omnitrophota bacterium]MDD5660577.1 alpha/beta fold hydrolase [Candidatus Omnitrophota bacterium]